MHDIEIYADGSAGYVGARVDAWHRLGTTLPAEFTVTEGFAAAKLADWNVRKNPLTTTLLDDTGVRTVPVPGRWVTIRSNPVTGRDELIGATGGIVGDRYTPFQNEQLADLLTALVDVSGAVIDTMGSLHRGRDVFIAMRLPEHIVVGGIDPVEQYLIVTNNHDGTSAITALISPVRVVCRNTLRAALGAARSSVKIRHTATAGQRIQQARDTLGIAWRYTAAFQQAADAMIDQTLTDREFARICAQLWPAPDPGDPPRSHTLHARRTATLRFLFDEADTTKAIRGTAWAGYQAVTEYLDHYAPVAGRGSRAKTLNRAARTVSSGAIAELKQHAFTLLQQPKAVAA
jgi:phage/plasmid-like protein (TIGR03299 family)